MSAGSGHDKPLSGTEPRRGFSALRSPNAPSVLGAEHPVSRSAVLIHTLVVQATATSSTVLVGVLAVAERRSWGVRLLASPSWSSSRSWRSSCSHARSSGSTSFG